MTAKEIYRRKLATLAQNAGNIADAAFADAVYEAVSAHGLSESLLRDTFGLTGGAVERWTQGQNLPQPLIRAKIINWISENI